MIDENKEENKEENETMEIDGITWHKCKKDGIAEDIEPSFEVVFKSSLKKLLIDGEWNENIYLDESVKKMVEEIKEEIRKNNER